MENKQIFIEFTASLSRNSDRIYDLIEEGNLNDIVELLTEDMQSYLLKKDVTDDDLDYVFSLVHAFKLSARLQSTTKKLECLIESSK